MGEVREETGGPCAPIACDNAPPPPGVAGRSPSPRQARGGIRFAGYAAVFDAVDRGGDVVRRGAFGRVRAVPLLWQHGGRPVGVIEVIGEDRRGLRVVGRVEDGRLAGLVATGAVSGLPFGYRATGVRRGAVRELTQVELVEVSLVAQPMQRLARVHAVEGLSENSRKSEFQAAPASVGTNAEFS